MTAEDMLRDLLRSEASTITPTGDGLARIQGRIAKRRRARLWLLPSAAVASAAAAVAFVLIAPEDPKTQTLQPASPSPTESAGPGPTPSPTADANVQPADSWKGAAFWPFASVEDLQHVADPVPPWLQDGLQVGQRLVRDVLELPDVTVTQTCVSCEVLALKVGSKDVGEIQLGHYTVRGTRVFTVVGIGGTDLTVTSPTSGTAVSSPTRVTGRITGVHENVNVKLVAKDGAVVGQAGAPAGGEVPWSTSVTWSTQDWSTGAVLGVTGSDKDGSITRVVLVPVSRGTAATSSSFAGIVDGHVALFDSTSGKQLRQLTYPPAGKTDTQATWSAGSLAWVRTAGASACANELDRIEDGGRATTVVSSTTVRYSWPQLSADAQRLAWVETPCSGDGPEQVVLTINGTEARRYTGPSGSVVNLFDVADDGALLLLTNDRQASGPGTIGVLPASADSLDGLRPLAPAAGCNLYSGAAFDGAGIAAFEVCGEDVRLVRFSATGQRVSTGASTKSEPPTSLSVRDGRLLVQLFGGDHYGDIAVVDGGRTTVLIDNSREDCSSVGNLKGCVRAPDW
ncbi:MAG TPA: Gmad2 immunoglobulin-like domain-containing protein [Mycobacteriales bacterium]|nr:Gmad2 immunoglobulin-like domain-containing protein [Mycobacteriales bacterium]